MRRRAIIPVLVCGLLAGAAAPGGIVGQDAMGDKGRSGPDGWSWAPVARDQGAAGKAPGQAEANNSGAPNAQPAQEPGKRLPPGQDPGTPAATEANGPGTIDKPASARTP